MGTSSLETDASRTKMIESFHTAMLHVSAFAYIDQIGTRSDDLGSVSPAEESCCRGCRVSDRLITPRSRLHAVGMDDI